MESGLSQATLRNMQSDMFYIMKKILRFLRLNNKRGRGGISCYVGNQCPVWKYFDGQSGLNAGWKLCLINIIVC
jgi:hypothetical protein